MKILIYLPNFGPIGGIEKHLINTIALFSRHGCSCTLMTIGNLMKEADRTQLQALGVQFIDDIRLQSSSRRSDRAVWLFKQVLKLKTSNTFDVIYTNATGISPGIVWLIGSKKTRIIHHHHTSGDADEERVWSKGYPLIIKKTPELIACSAATAINLKRFRKEKPIKVLYCLADEMLTCSNYSKVFLPPLNKTTLNIGFFGRVTSGKGIDWIATLSSEPEFQNVEFHIHGSGSEYTEDFFAALTNVRYFGPYSTAAEQLKRLRSVDCVILPSTHVEGLPLTLLEAMSAGKPWVATDRGGVRELAVSEKDCIVTAPTIEGFSAGLIQMLNNLRGGLTNEARLYDLYRRNFSLFVRQEAWLSYFKIQP